MPDIRMFIDGQVVVCPSGTRVLEAADRAGIRIPRLCSHPELEPYGACRLCLVEDEKSGRILASCVTLVAPDMAVRTNSERVLAHRKNIVRLMIAEHPESCLVCSKGNRCQLRQIAAELGIGEHRLDPMPNVQPLQEANPFLVRDLSKCVLCGRCIRVDHELVVVGAIDYVGRGFATRPATVHETDLGKSSCTFCGTCVSACPTGALSEKKGRSLGTPEREARSICGFCGAGCALKLGLSGERVVEVGPVPLLSTANGHTLCVRGHFAHDYLLAADRLTQPLIREDGRLVPASWEQALEVTARGLLETKRENGPSSLAFLGSSKCTNEENYLFQKIARVLLETNNIDHTGSPYGREARRRLDQRTGGRWRPQPFADLARAEAILVLGAEPTHSVPVLGYHLKRAARHGVPLIVADPRRTELVSHAALWLRPRPGRSALLLHGLAALVLASGQAGPAAPGRALAGFEAYQAALETLDLQELALETGLEIELMKEAAGLLQGRKTALVAGPGLTERPEGAAAVDALVNLHLLLGGFGPEAGGIYLTLAENNQAGALDMGAVPNALPGGAGLRNDAERKRWERAWQMRLSPDPGLDLRRMVLEAGRGSLKAMYVMGENPIRSLPQPGRVKEALGRLDLLVVQDVLMTETAELAHVVLPGAAFAEKGGCFTNMEGRVQVFGPAAAPPGSARPDWEILNDLAARLGQDFAYRSEWHIREEIRKLASLYASVRDTDGGWVTSAAGNGYHRDQPIFVMPTRPAAPPADPDYPITLLLGATRFHLGSGTRTSRSPRLRAMNLACEIEISPLDGAALGVKDQDPVRVVSRAGSIEAVVRLREALPPGVAFAARGADGNRVMQLAALEEYGTQALSVRLERL